MTDAPDAAIDAGPYGSGPRPAWLEIDWSRYERTIDAAGARVNLVDTGGDGPAIVFLHGHSASWQHWLEQVPEFMAGHRVVAVDHPGFGISALENSEITITRYAQVVDGVMDGLGIDSAAVVGNSMGGFIAAELASRFPARVDRLVLVSAAGLGERYIGIPNDYFVHPVGARVVDILFGHGPLPERFLKSAAARPRGRIAAMTWMVTHPDQLYPGIAWEVLRDLGRPGGPGALRACVTYAEFRDLLGDIACPTLIVWGEKDLVVSVDSGHDYLGSIAGARLLVYRDTGHLPMIERPERFNTDLRSFLSEESAASPPASADAPTIAT